MLVIPGPTILTVISYSIAHGRRVRLPLMAAVALGDCTALALSLLGLGALLAFVNVSLYAAFASKARELLASPRAQRGFHLAGGSLLSAAGVWAMLARRAA